MTSKILPTKADGRLASDRDLDCEEFLQSGFEGLVDRALAAGWSEDEIGNALLSIAQERVVAARDNAFADIGLGRISYHH